MSSHCLFYVNFYDHLFFFPLAFFLKTKMKYSGKTTSHLYYIRVSPGPLYLLFGLLSSRENKRVPACLG